jgi:hypothetical protein
MKESTMSAYTVIVPPPKGLPRGLVVRVVVMRKDAAPLTRDELERCAEAFPPGPRQRAQFRRDLELAPESRPAKRKPSKGKPGRGAKRAPAKRSKGRA